MTGFVHILIRSGSSQQPLKLTLQVRARIDELNKIIEEASFYYLHPLLFREVPEGPRKQGERQQAIVSCI